MVHFHDFRSRYHPLHFLLLHEVIRDQILQLRLVKLQLLLADPRHVEHQLHRLLLHLLIRQILPLHNDPPLLLDLMILINLILLLKVLLI